jgi:hypothetical protein
MRDAVVALDDGLAVEIDPFLCSDAPRSNKPAARARADADLRQNCLLCPALVMVVCLVVYALFTSRFALGQSR